MRVKAFADIELSSISVRIQASKQEMDRFVPGIIYAELTPREARALARRLWLSASEIEMFNADVDAYFTAQEKHHDATTQPPTAPRHAKGSRVVPSGHRPRH